MDQVPTARRAGAAVDPAVPVPDDEGEARLVRRVAGGDQEACRLLVERHLAAIVAFATRMLGDHAEAEDVAQETFTRLWRHAGRWRPGKARLTTWLHRIAANLCIDRLRRRREAPLDATLDPPDPASGPAEQASARELGRHVEAALLALPERQRLALVLCHHQGLPNDEAAAVMEVSVDALESLLARGRRTMRSRLRALATDPGGALDR